MAFGTRGIILPLLVLLSSCTTVEAIGNARALSDRQVEHAVVVLDERKFAYDRAREVRRKQCQSLEDAADRLKFTCPDMNCPDQMDAAYEQAHACWKKAEPPITDAVRWVEDLRELKEAIEARNAL